MAEACDAHTVEAEIDDLLTRLDLWELVFPGPMRDPASINSDLGRQARSTSRLHIHTSTHVLVHVYSHKNTNTHTCTHHAMHTYAYNIKRFLRGNLF